MAVTSTSAGNSRPDEHMTPVGVTVAIRSVTTSAAPLFMARKKSASGTTHSRWSHGS